MILRLVFRTLLAPASSAAALILSIRLWEAISRKLAAKGGQRFVPLIWRRISLVTYVKWMPGRVVEVKVSPWHKSHNKNVEFYHAGREALAAHPVVSDIY
ncbi:hypothetical protein FB451DRAFT_1240182 [Mycena latifolia]|nr:hypothetical protein FB451DRAFT_1240182 [Mycena latifolia]